MPDLDWPPASMVSVEEAWLSSHAVRGSSSSSGERSASGEAWRGRGMPSNAPSDAGVEDVEVEREPGAGVSATASAP